MKYLFLLSLLFSISACKTNKHIYYSYNGTSITRIDFDGYSNFYYGTCKYGSNCPITYIKAEYFGFNNGMDVYLVFKKTGEVELIHFGGEYLMKIGDCSIRIPNYNSDKLDIIIDSYKQVGTGIMRLSNSVELEKKFLENKHTEVSVIYE